MGNNNIKRNNPNILIKIYSIKSKPKNNKKGFNLAAGGEHNWANFVRDNE